MTTGIAIGCCIAWILLCDRFDTHPSTLVIGLLVILMVSCSS